MVRRAKSDAFGGTWPGENCPHELRESDTTPLTPLYSDDEGMIDIHKATAVYIRHARDFNLYCTLYPTIGNSTFKPREELPVTSKND
jgi:hypothetical protein